MFAAGIRKAVYFQMDGEADPSISEDLSLPSELTENQDGTETLVPAKQAQIQNKKSAKEEEATTKVEELSLSYDRKSAAAQNTGGSKTTNTVKGFM